MTTSPLRRVCAFSKGWCLTKLFIPPLRRVCASRLCVFFIYYLTPSPNNISFVGPLFSKGYAFKNQYHPKNLVFKKRCAIQRTYKISNLMAHYYTFTKSTFKFFKPVNFKSKSKTCAT